MAPRRPGPAQWIWYALGGKLPQRYAEWVFHDVTCSSWVVRHLARAALQMSFVLLVLLLPGPWDIRLMTMALGVLAGGFYSVCYMGEAAEHRLIKHGYPPGIGKETRAMHREARRVTKYGEQRPWWH